MKTTANSRNRDNLSISAVGTIKYNASCLLPEVCTLGLYSKSFQFRKFALVVQTVVLSKVILWDWHASYLHLSEIQEKELDRVTKIKRQDLQYEQSWADMPYQNRATHA